MSCYCISHTKDVRSEPDEPSSSMELDAALHELGMLSRITDSRTDFLQEKIQVKKKRSSNSLSSAPLCVVQMNSKFITKWSTLSKNFQSHSDSEEEKTETEVESNSRRTVTRFKSNSHRYWRKVARAKPYDTAGFSRKLDTAAGFRERDAAAGPSYIPVVAAAAAAEERVSSPSVSRQDSGGNKSNPSSPVKSQNSLPPSGASIVRSRSLDDLEIAKVVEDGGKEDCYCRYGRSDIETVSQRISNLHVS